MYSIKELIPWSRPWEANSRSVSQEIPRLLWNLNVHYRAYKRQPLVAILIQTNLIHIPFP
jgi:hypothetical protein